MAATSGSDDGGVYVEVFVRSLSPRTSRRRLEEIVARLDRLVAADAILQYRVRPTGTELPATPADALTEYGSYLLNRVAAFQEWAAATGRSLGSTVDRRTVYSRFTGEEHDALVLPTVLVAEYDGRALRFVAPCEADGERVTVLDRLDALASEEDLGDEGLPRAAAGLPDEPSPSER